MLGRTVSREITSDQSDIYQSSYDNNFAALLQILVLSTLSCSRRAHIHAIVGNRLINSQFLENHGSGTATRNCHISLLFPDQGEGMIPAVSSTKNSLRL